MPALGLGLGTHIYRLISSGFTGLLDTYGGADRAYSTLRLSSAITNVIRARRDADDAESDFTADEITDGTMLNWANVGTSSLYSQYMYFDGTDDYISYASYISAITASTAFSVEGYFITPDVTTGQVLFHHSADGSNRFAIYVSGVELSAGIYNGSSYFVKKSGSISANTLYKVKVSFDGSTTFTLSLNDVSQSGTNSPISHSSNFIIGRNGTATNYYKGITYGWKVYDDATWTNQVWGTLGDGITAGNWTDTIGSNDGTVNGTPALYSGQPYNAYVATWYDQSGNGLNATQSTSTLQGQIVSSGSVLSGGVTFDGSDDLYSMTETGNSANQSVFYRAAPNASGADATILGLSSATTTAIWDANASGNITWNQGGVTDETESLQNAYSATGSHVGTLIRNNTAQTLASWKDGVAGDSSSTYSAASTTGYNQIGKAAAGSPLNGTIQSIVIYESDQTANRAGIEAFL